MSVIGAFHQVALAETYIDPGTGTVRVNDSIPLTPSFGAIWYTAIDLGFPDVRTSMQERPEADGVFDETRFHGSRSVVFEGLALQGAFGELPYTWHWASDVDWDNASYWISHLSSWASPARRFRFYFTDENHRSRFMDVRGDSFSAQTDMDEYSHRRFQLGMVNPSGRIYSFAQGPGATVDGRWEKQIAFSVDIEGRAYPKGYESTYPDTFAGNNAVPYKGTVPTGCLVKLYTGNGTVTGPRITFTAPDRTEQSVGFSSGLVVPAFTTLLIDTINRTATYRTDTSSTSVNVASYLDAPMQWPQLRPGMNKQAPTYVARTRGYNQVAFTAVSVASTSHTLKVVWHDADLF